MFEFALVVEGVARPLDRRKVIKVPNGTQHPYEITRLWSTADLEAIGVLPIAYPSPPSGQRLVDWTGPEFDSKTGVVMMGAVWEDIPPGPTDEEIADETVEDAFVRRDIAMALAKATFVQENRLRALEGKNPITPAEFKAWLKARMTES